MKKGIAASKGYSIGKVLIKEDIDLEIEEKKIDDIELEKDRLNKALKNSKEQLIKIKEKTKRELGVDKAAVFESHIMLLNDPEFAGTVKYGIETKKVNAEKALYDVMKMYEDIFESMEDEYMKERGADIKDVGKRILANLLGEISMSYGDMEENTVIVAHDLTPSDTANLDKSKVIAFLTDIGGRTSHSAIMARTLEIPAVVGINDITKCVKNGDIVIVDGVEGIVIVNPDKNTIKEYQANRQKYLEENEKLKRFVKVETITKEGKRVEVSGNIGRPEDIKQVIKNGGDGVGLFRTEFLYMNRDDAPGENEQFEAYKYVTQKMNGGPVVIRTLDIGGDKKLPYLNLPEEINPFLGYRAIRLCLDEKELFKIQLRAMLRASAFGNLKIMFPMISSLDEFLKAREILKECMMELQKEGEAYNENLEVGIMVEVPSAAICADELAKCVDFFSIGTNDLIQYVFAADRMNERVAYLYNPMHPAVLKLIKMTIDAAHREGKWCGMCGEMAADEKAVPTLVKYGLDEFSMSASSILKAKQLIIQG